MGANNMKHSWDCDYKMEIVGQNPVILFGMGKNGLQIAETIKNLLFFVDNMKVGEKSMEKMGGRLYIV